MDPHEQKTLSSMVDQLKEDYQDNTDYLREQKRSILLRDDILRMEKLKRDYVGDRTGEDFVELCRAQCPYLFSEYTIIFNKQVKDCLNLTIMFRLLQVLRDIEDGKINQDEGSVQVGRLLKDIYIDSSQREGALLDARNAAAAAAAPQPNEGKFLSWKQYKLRGNRDYGGPQ